MRAFRHGVSGACFVSPEAYYQTLFHEGSHNAARLGVHLPQIDCVLAAPRGFLVSPYAKPASVFQGLCDHTSILQFLGEMHGGGAYSKIVTDRLTSGSINSLSTALAEDLQSQDEYGKVAFRAFPQLEQYLS